MTVTLHYDILWIKHLLPISIQPTFLFTVPVNAFYAVFIKYFILCNIFLSVIAIFGLPIIMPKYTKQLFEVIKRYNIWSNIFFIFISIVYFSGGYDLILRVLNVHELQEDEDGSKYYGVYLPPNCPFDHIGLFFMFLTLIFFCLFLKALHYNTSTWKLELGNYLLLELLLILCFITKDLLVFFICFELVLIPLVFLIGHLGELKYRIRAFYYLFFYTTIGSLPFLFTLFYIYYTYGTFTYSKLYLLIQQECTITNEIPLSHYLMFFSIFLAFAVKTPLVPFHLWLTEAHVRASTSGSIILAALILKLGTYGLLTIALPMFYLVYTKVKYFICLLCLLGALHAAICACSQVDLKMFVAYTSVSHMSLGVSAFFTGEKIAIHGGILFMVAHTFISSLLFYLVGLLSYKLKTRNILKLAGLGKILPGAYGLFLIGFILNVSGPVSGMLVGEFFMAFVFFKIHLVYFLIFALVGLVNLVAHFSIFIKIFGGQVSNEMQLALTKKEFMEQTSLISSKIEYKFCRNLIIYAVLSGLYLPRYLNILGPFIDKFDGSVASLY